MLCCCRGVGPCGVPSCGAVVVVASCGCSWLFVYLSIHPSIHLSTCTFENETTLCEIFPIFEPHNIKKAARLRDVHHFPPWQQQKKSARPLRFFKVATSKTKHFCEISLKNRKVSTELTASCQSVLRFSHSNCSKCACHDKVMPGHAKCCTCHAKSY